MKTLLNGSVFYRTLIFFTLILVLVLASILSFYILPLKRLALKDNLFEKANAIADLSEPVLARALKNQDDLSLLSQIEKMMRVSDISTVYVLDGKGKVITHDKIGEWGRVYNDEITKKILSGKKRSMYISQEARGYIYSAPLMSSATLCIGLSSDKLDTRYGLVKKNAAYVSATILFLSVFIVTGFLIFQLRSQFRSLETRLKSLKTGMIDRLEIETENEFAEISRLINQLVDKCKSQEKAAMDKINTNTESDLLMIKAVLDNFNKGFIITNSYNKVIYINNEISQQLSLNREKCLGRHIVDVLDKPGYIEILKKSAEELNRTVEQKVNGHFFKVISVGNEKKEIVGTIISV